MSVNTQEVSHNDFNELDLMLEWFKLEWGDLHDPIVDDVVELEEDYSIESISQPLEVSSTEIEVRY